ncbi:MAG: DUF997 family protein [Planctomycetaceae bacterium]
MSAVDPASETRRHEPVEFDPVYLNARREAIVVFCLWLTALIWAVPFCYLNGYDYDPESFSTTWGVPTWLFWGILVPWIVADVFTIWFCFCYMKEDDLGEAHEGADLEEEIVEMHEGGTGAGQ